MLPESDPRRRVTFVLHKFSRGGSDRVAAHLARGFAEAGMDVDMVIVARGGEVEDLLIDLLGDDIPLVHLGRAGRSRALDLVRGFRPLAKHLKQRQPDVVISTANNTALVTVLAAKAAGIDQSLIALKTTNPIASSRHHGLVRAFRRWSYRRIFLRTEAVWTLSAAESAEMREAFPTHADLFREVAQPYVTDAMLANPAGSSTPTGNLVVSVARLTEQKRLDRLIAGFAEVTTPDARLVILGEGEDRASLQMQVSALGLEDSVTMPGYVPDVADFLHCAKVSILTSKYEGFPAALLESMAANCAIASTDCFPGARDFVKASEGGEIIEETDPTSVGALIDLMLSRPRPTRNRQIAELYSVAFGVASHRAALEKMIADGLS